MKDSMRSFTEILKDSINMENISQDILNQSSNVLKKSLKVLQVVDDLFIGMIFQYVHCKCRYSCSDTNTGMRHSQS